MKGYIYKLYCKDEPNVIYIGSTKSTLKQRLSGHKYDYKRGRGASSRSIIEKGNSVIELLEEIEFENIKELRKKEREYIERMNCVNIYSPHTTNEEVNRRRRERYKNDTEYRRKSNERNNNYYKCHTKKKYEYSKRHREELKSKGIDPDAKAKQRVICPNCNKEMCYAHLRKRHYKICPALTN